MSGIMIRGCLYAAFALLMWGVTFANTRALLFDFSALEIMVVRFAMAWIALWGMDAVGRRTAERSETAEGRRSPRPTVLGDELLFARMGLTGVCR